MSKAPPPFPFFASYSSLICSGLPFTSYLRALTDLTLLVWKLTFVVPRVGRKLIYISIFLTLEISIIICFKTWTYICRQRVFESLIIFHWKKLYRTSSRTVTEEDIGIYVDQVWSVEESNRLFIWLGARHLSTFNSYNFPFHSKITHPSYVHVFRWQATVHVPYLNYGSLSHTTFFYILLTCTSTFVELSYNHHVCKTY